MKRLIALFIATLVLTTTTPALHNIGQRFIITLPDTQDFKQLETWFERIKPGGVMLTASHVKARDRTKKLTTFLQKAANKFGIEPLLICIDWEGGIVSRPNESGGFFSIPSPWSLAQAGRSTCFLAGMLIGHQLADVGINVNFAPSLDLFNPNNYILATRCFDAHPDKVAECGIAFAKGLMCQGVLPVIKHFPGLGLGLKDTHLDQTTIIVDQTTFDHHKKPFEQALQSEIPACMAGHAIYQQFGDQPVTLNNNAVNYLKKINPDVLLVTDDFCMQAVRAGRTLEDACRQSLEAGYHLIILSPALAPEFIKKNSGTISLEDMLKQLALHCNTSKNAEYLNQITRIKEKYLTNGKTLLPIDEQQLSIFLAHRCLQTDMLMQQQNRESIILISAKLTAIRPAEQWLISDEKSYLHKLLKTQNIKISEYLFDPTNQASIKALKDLVNKLDKHAVKNIFVQTMFYGGGKWNAIQKQWLEILAPLQKNLTIISLGHPHEQTILPQAKSINLGSFHKPLLTTLVDRLCSEQPLTGADQLIAYPEKFLAGKRFGLLCHRCSVAHNNGKSEFLPDLLKQWADKQKKSTKLAALFSPEHGLLGNQEAFAFINSENKTQWDCPVYSLHGTHKSPTPDMLKDLDLLVVDLQDVGTRCFTYLSTLKLTLEAAAKQKLPILVLDRPNPLMQWGSTGPKLEPEHESFLGKIYKPFLHGVTIGQLAQDLNEKIGAQLQVLSSKNVTENYFLSRTFIPPSPNIMSFDHTLAYPMTVFVEGINYSEGRGTEYPFLQIGAPWVNAEQLAQQLNKKNLSGVYFEPIRFIPRSIPGIAETPKHQDSLCQGVFLHIHDKQNVKPIIVAQTLLHTLFDLYPGQSKWVTYGKRYALDLLVGNSSWRSKILTCFKNNSSKTSSS